MPDNYFCSRDSEIIKAWTLVIWDHQGFEFSWGSICRLKGCCPAAVWLGVCTQFSSPTAYTVFTEGTEYTGSTVDRALGAQHLFQALSSPGRSGELIHSPLVAQSLWLLQSRAGSFSFRHTHAVFIVI